MTNNSDSLKEIEIFFEPLKIAGLPNKTFLMLLYVVGSVGFLIAAAYAIFLAIILFPVFSAIHKDDVNAIKVWIRFVSRRIIAISPFTKKFINYRIK